MQILNQLGRAALVRQLLPLLKRLAPPVASSLITASLILSFNFMSNNKTIHGDGDIVGRDKHTVENHSRHLHIQQEINNIHNSVTNIKNYINEMSEEITIISSVVNEEENIINVDTKFDIKNSMSNIETNFSTIRNELGKITRANETVNFEQSIIYRSQNCDEPPIVGTPNRWLDKPNVQVPPNGSKYWAEEEYMGAW
jgi:hypothetical protein